MANLSTAVYQAEGERTQVECPHRIRNDAGDECSTCGSRRVGNRWRYLSPDWFHYYMNGGPRPE